MKEQSDSEFPAISKRERVAKMILRKEIFTIPTGRHQTDRAGAGNDERFGILLQCLKIPASENSYSRFIAHYATKVLEKWLRWWSVETLILEWIKYV